MKSSHYKHISSCLALILFCALGVGSIDSKALGSKAKASITNLKGGHDMGIYNDEPDYGVKVTCTLTNVGEAGSVTVTPWITCSEGEWEKSQTFQMSAGQSMNLTYFFEQPTVNSTNIQYGVKFFPK